MQTDGTYLAILSHSDHAIVRSRLTKFLFGLPLQWVNAEVAVGILLYLEDMASSFISLSGPMRDMLVPLFAFNMKGVQASAEADAVPMLDGHNRIQKGLS